MSNDALTFKFGQPLFAAAWPSPGLLLVAGGGGKPGSGIENRIIAARYDGNALSDEVASVRLKSACQKLAVSTTSNLVLAVTDQCIVPYMLAVDGARVQFIVPQAAVINTFSTFADRVTALRFSKCGRYLVLGSEAGTLHLLHASRCTKICEHLLRKPDEEPVNSEIKDLDILVPPGDQTAVNICASTDAGDCYFVTLKVDVASGSPGAATVQACTQLPKPKQLENGSIKHVRFAEGDIIASINYRGTGRLCCWQQLKGLISRPSTLSPTIQEPITGMDVSSSGATVAVVTPDGHTLQFRAATLALLQRNKRAHMVLGTDVAFAPDGGAFLSVSGDASARVNVVVAPRSSAGLVLALLLVLLVAAAALVGLWHAGMLQGEVERRVGEVVGLVGSWVEGTGKAAGKPLQQSGVA